MHEKYQIIPGESLAGIRLGDNIEHVISKVSGYYKISTNDGVILLDDGIITVGYEDNGSVYSVMCDKRFKVKYKSKLWAGMSVKDVLEHSKEQVAFGGCVIVDRINGVGLPLPNEFDDFEKITDFLPLDFTFEYLSVFRI